MTTSGPQPADFADVRATNLAVVLRQVRAHAPCSRADIAARTGLNKATVSSLVGELIDRRLGRETGFDQLTVVAVDLAGVELVSWRRAYTANGANAAKGPSALIGKAVARVGALDREVLGLTVGVPGPVDATGNVPVLADLRRG